jgi:hypothetical protein
MSWMRSPAVRSATRVGFAYWPTTSGTVTCVTVVDVLGGAVGNVLEVSLAWVVFVVMPEPELERIPLTAAVCDGVGPAEQSANRRAAARQLNVTKALGTGPGW